METKDKGSQWGSQNANTRGDDEQLLIGYKNRVFYKLCPCQLLVDMTNVGVTKVYIHCAIFRCARLCPCQPTTSLLAAAWPRCTSAQMEPTCTGSGLQPVLMRRHRKATLSSWMSFSCLWVLFALPCTVLPLRVCLFPVWWFLSLPVLGADTDRVVCCRHLAGESYFNSQGRRVFKVLEWASPESNVTLPGLPFCHIGCSHRLCNHQHGQRGAVG